MQEISELSQLHLMVLSEKRGGQPETETHSLGPALQGCELTHNLTTHLLPFVVMLYTVYQNVYVLCRT